MGVLTKFTGNTNHFFSGYAGDLLLPGRSVRLDFIVGDCAVVFAQATADAVVGHHQVVYGNHESFATIGQLYFAATQLVSQSVADFNGLEVVMLDAAKVRESYINHFVMLFNQGQLQADIFSFGSLLQVPLALFAPAIADRAVRRGQLVAGFINGNGFPLGVVLFTQTTHQITGAQEPARYVTAIFHFFEFHQVRHVGVATHVIGEILTGVVEVELFEDDMPHSYTQSGICTLLGVQPLIRQLGDFCVIRGNGNGLGALVAHFGKEVGIRRTGLRHVGTPGNDVA